MGIRQHGRIRGTVVLGAVSLLSAALVAATPAAAGGGNGNGNAYGNTKHDSPPPPPVTPPTDPGTGTGSSGGGGGVVPNAAPVNSFSATLAFVDTTGKRVVVGTAPVKAVIVIKNTSTTTNSFGSAAISVAGGFTICTSPLPCLGSPTADSGFTGSFGGSTINVHGNPGIAPGSSVTVGAWLRPPAACNVSGLNWVVQVRQTTGFGGATFTGGPATPLGFLKFTNAALPVATAYNQNLSPSPIVTSYNPCGVAAAPTNPVTLTDALSIITLSGSSPTLVSGTDSTFGAVQFSSFDQTDTLTAVATNYTPSDPSTAFLVAEKVQPCTSNNCQPLSVSQTKTGAVVTPVFDSLIGNVLVSGSALPQDTTMCGEDTSNIDTSQISSTIAVDTPVSKTVTFTLDKVLVLAISNNGAPFMSVCMRVPNQPDVTLPDCTKAGVTLPPPCVVSRNKNHGNEIIVVQLPAGDPHFNVY